MSKIADVLRLAAAEVGYNRFADPNPGTKYGRFYAELVGNAYYGTSGVPYCAMFVTYIMHMAGVSVPGLPGAYCPWIKTAGVKAGLAIDPHSAFPGDIVLFDWGGDGVCDHIGIVEKNCGNYLQTIEGNTSVGSSGSQSNGGRVARRTRSFSTINCVIHPSYDDCSVPAPVAPTNNASGLVVDGWIGHATIRTLQSALGTPVDGVVSGQTANAKKYWTVFTAGLDMGRGGSQMVTALQRKVGAGADGYLGQESAYKTQQYLYARGYDPQGIDGYFGRNSASALQRCLNDGRF